MYDAVVRVGIDFRGAELSGGSGLRGIGRYSTDVVLGLIEHAPSVELVLFVRNQNGIPPELQGRVKVKEIGLGPGHPPSKPWWMYIPKVRSSFALHRRHFEKILAAQTAAMEQALQDTPVDLVHVLSGLDIGSFPIFRSKAPKVLTFLDAIVHRLPEHFMDRFPPHGKDYYQRQVSNLQDSAKIIAISEASAHDAHECFGVPTEKLAVVYPAVSTAYAIPADRSDQAPKNPYFLFCSVPDPHKNPRLVMEAFSKLEGNYELVFIAPNDAMFAPGLREYASSLGIVDRFHITGFVPEEAMPGFFQHALALVSPSLMEGFGLPVAQAMRAGTPVITSNVSAQAEIGAKAGWLVDPHSPEELLLAMKAVIEDQAEVKRKVEIGKLEAEKFNLQKVTEELVKAYEQVIT